MTKPTMLDYVRETPHVVRGQLEGCFERPLVDAFMAGEYRYVRIVASGSSRNASLIARPYLRRMLGREVLVTEPYTFCTYESELPDDEFCFVISQSGYSTNALAALATIRQAGRVAIGVTGDLESDFRVASDVVVPYGVSEEQVGYVTKGVTALATFLMLFGAQVAENEGRFDLGDTHAAIRGMLDRFESALAQVTGLHDARYKELSSMERVFLIGAGANYGIASEGALKFAECLQIPAQAFELDEYLHGPNLQLSPEYTVFFVAVGERSWARTRQIVDATRRVTDRVFITTDCPDMEADIRLMPGGDELVTSLAALPVFQALAWQLTEEKHLWHKHPLVAQFDAALSGKSSNYVDKEVL